MRPFFCTLDCEYCVSWDCPYRKGYVDSTASNGVFSTEETAISKVCRPTKVTKKKLKKLKNQIENTMTQEEIKTFNELYRKFQKECERVKEVLSTLPHQIGGDIYLADYFYRICDMDMDDAVLWIGYDETYEEVNGSFPLEYLSLTDDELKAIVDEEKRKFEEEQLAKRAEADKKEKEIRKELYEQLKKEFES